MFFSFHDPTVFHKRQYMSAIFYHDDEQKSLANEMLAEEQRKYRKPIMTEIAPAGTFYDAEDYHQKYLLRSNKSLFRSLGLEGEALKASTMAAKLNGYCGGFGTIQSFEKESVSWPLGADQKRSMVDLIVKGGLEAQCGAH